MDSRRTYEKGIKQSIELKNQIDVDEIDLVISSDLQRALVAHKAPQFAFDVITQGKDKK